LSGVSPILGDFYTIFAMKKSAAVNKLAFFWGLVAIFLEDFVDILPYLFKKNRWKFGIKHTCSTESEIIVVFSHFPTTLSH
jgi:hypothetical protein